MATQINAAMSLGIFIISPRSDPQKPSCFCKLEPLEIHFRERPVGGLPLGAMNFLFGELDQAVQVPREPFLQQRVQQHGAQRRRESERQSRVHVVAQPAVHHLDQRDVGLDDGFKQPVFLQELFMFRMTDKREMGVEN